MEDRKFICPCYRHEIDIAENGHCICHLFVDDNYRPTEIDDPPVREKDSPWPKIVVYGAHWCTDSLRTRRFLNRHGIPYVLLDVTRDPEASQQVKVWNQGLLATPTLKIGDRIVVEPSDEELGEILGV